MVRKKISRAGVLIAEGFVHNFSLYLSTLSETLVKLSKGKNIKKFLTLSKTDVKQDCR